MTITECEPPHLHLTEDVVQLREQFEEAFKQPDTAGEPRPSLDATFRAGIQKASEKVIVNVQGLVSSIHEIQSSFSAIRKDLHAFDLDAESTGATKGPLKPQWEIYHGVWHLHLL